MRNAIIGASILICSYLDTVFFARVNIVGIRPDAMLALMVSLGVLMGSVPGALIGGITGLILDVLFSKTIGLSAIAYMIAGAAAGFFYKKFYADNIIIPSITAVVCSFLKEHIMAGAVAAMGGNMNYVSMLLTYIIPSALMTGLLCILIHIVLKRALSGQVRKDAQNLI